MKILKKRAISKACIQETKSVGSKAQDIDGFKLSYLRYLENKNGVGVLVDGDFRE